MCGILFHYNQNQALENGVLEFQETQVLDIIKNGLGSKIPNSSQIFNSLVPKICSRGPNYSSLLVENNNMLFFSSVLSLRSPFTKQPLESSRYIIQFNGELYNNDIDGNDTQYIMNLLDQKSVIDTIHTLDGEFAFTIYDKKEQNICFGRDPVGKRSLAYYLKNEELYISSVQPGFEERSDFIDCDNGSIYQYSFKDKHLEIVEHAVTYNINSNTDKDFKNIEDRLNKLNNVLIQSIKQRIHNIDPFHIESETDPLYAILFSGGLDCTVIAGLAASISKPETSIDLFNVGFDNPRTGMKASEAPDRKLAIESWLNLSKQFPSINFNLIEIDIQYEEYLETRPKVIELMYPKNTEMDLSIAIAFYFASRGKGNRLSLHDVPLEQISYSSAKTVEHYQSKAKVLLSGLGADELYGGYHKFANKDNESLAEELTRQINNIHERNLQRDDKVISDNGVEVRYPFLSHDVIQFSTQEIEINYKISKLILRKLASQIGLEFVSEEPKRAIQFGAKSAKMTANGNKKGTDELK